MCDGNLLVDQVTKVCTLPMVCVMLSEHSDRNKLLPGGVLFYPVMCDLIIQLSHNTFSVFMEGKHLTVFRMKNKNLRVKVNYCPSFKEDISLILGEHPELSVNLVSSYQLAADEKHTAEQQPL